MSMNFFSFANNRTRFRNIDEKKKKHAELFEKKKQEAAAAVSFRSNSKVLFQLNNYLFIKITSRLCF